MTQLTTQKATAVQGRPVAPRAVAVRRPGQVAAGPRAAVKRPAVADNQKLSPFEAEMLLAWRQQ